MTSDSSATGYNATKSVVASFTRSSAGAVSIGTISVDTSKTLLYDAGAGSTQVGIVDGLRDSAGAIGATGTSIATMDISALTDSSADLAILDGYIKGADAGMKEMTSAATNLGAVKQRVDMQKSFVSALASAIDRGVSQLVDADMNEESTRLQALQVKQQLGVQALSIANSSGQSILSLFR